MDLRSSNQGLQIKVDSSNVAVTYQTFDPQEYVTGINCFSDKIQKPSLFHFFPNPSFTEIMVEMEGLPSSLEINITDLNGNIMKQLKSISKDIMQ